MPLIEIAINYERKLMEKSARITNLELALGEIISLSKPANDYSPVKTIQMIKAIAEATMENKI